MRQRVSLARTLASEPKILLMDEPFAALDEQTRLLLGDKVLQIQQQLKQTTLLITHNITEAVQMSDRILVMTYRPGKVKRIVDIDLPRPRTSEIVGSEAFGRYVAQIWSDLREEASRGMRDEEGHALHHRGRVAMTDAAPATAQARAATLRRAVVGLGSLIAAFLAVEVLIRAGVDQPLHRAAAVGDRRQLLPHHHRGACFQPLSADRRRMPGRRRHAHRRSASPSAC